MGEETMTQQDVIRINRSVKIEQSTNKLIVTKAFAEKNLSESALKYATKSNTHYSWDWGTTAFIVVFELPALFELQFGELLRYLINFCKPYMEENKLTDNVIYVRYMDNCNKTIK